MKPIQVPIAVVIWACFPLWLLWYNWGWWENSGRHFWPELLFPLFIGVMACGLILLGVIALAYYSAEVIGRRADCVWSAGWKADLASIRNSDGVRGSIQGSIFLMSGRVDAQEVYYYYTTDGPDRYKPNKWYPDSDTTVIEENRSDGAVESFETTFKKPWLHWVATPNDRIRMDFRIPKGSLVQQYSLK